MSLLLETIRINKGKPENLKFHEERITSSQLVLEGLRLLPPLEEIIEDSPAPPKGIFKARLVYNRDLYKIEFLRYKKVQITSLYVRKENSLYYPFKFADRSKLNKLKENLGPKTEALIVIGDRITDTTFTNVALWDGKKWLSPMYPLLKGTRRALLIQQGSIELQDIKLSQLMNFEKVKLFNAMIPWDEALEIPINQIHS